MRFLFLLFLAIFDLALIIMFYFLVFIILKDYMSSDFATVISLAVLLSSLVIWSSVNLSLFEDLK